MTEPAPIACTLDQAQRLRRERDIESVARRGLLSVERQPRRVTLRFRREDAVRRGVAEIAAAEAECCPFLDFALTEEPEALVLDIRSPPDGEALLHQLADAFAGRLAPQ